MVHEKWDIVEYRIEGDQGKDTRKGLGWVCLTEVWWRMSKSCKVVIRVSSFFRQLGGSFISSRQSFCESLPEVEGRDLYMCDSSSLTCRKLV